ncbi:hypothetical protein A2803_02470 [Candidatus Woesebacteria bacterium RIFCSPHIGHO2_01_FULL_44_21]|uniref:Antitoxin n=1 Tax=Candidatus Woesebacteria bacterium RIFCSPHIGHO2_01_FULL_44_21 TaxID=1802503 RepID=A0A1F7Z052_9BACT|nr:MAG: hypothetical protein A2803_02470 [Candidatus Woesebacteria bacterium RIFCSPHIGHO2_01_FULL_44_21]OGM71566.1 MAG: hypothetical protein A2897_01465 [Candidatus Woesebacteria bacterium RIFCSPLOWO2_01_FULL_44_24b]
MSTAIINIKTDPELKAHAQAKAAKMGLSLSAVINKSLKEFVKKKKTPYGIFAGADISDEDLYEITHSLDKEVDEIVNATK